MNSIITHELVDEATARFLAEGGAITRLPDTVEAQRRWLDCALIADGADDMDHDDA